MSAVILTIQYSGPVDWAQGLSLWRLLVMQTGSRQPGEPDDKVYATLKELEDAGHKVRT
jgi:hypothetical protein